ncbi:hypothetical protein AB0G60_07455 [Streptomyces angustmyceticus]|uniref:Lipoprotein n=1 Tax=Streptomyces angustmyceticus TaxID=285578 RepID=A0A5J4LDK3_9ACTN|nr:hypothetical protein [Streptomyces angustmyceticus]UAL69286.1 hypothetical protein K7396_24385 [Streptomyces angustmyceticus]GES29436.1 hypothetical protein San01_19230 [Streptomyces angustmyceticus]
MFTRRLLAAAAATAALAALTSCKGEDPAAAPETHASAAASPRSTPTDAESAPPTDAPTDGPSPAASASEQKDLPIDPEPSSDCTPARLAKGHRMVQVTGAPAGGRLSAKEARFACDPNGGGYAGAGKAAAYRLAAGATAELTTSATGHRTVPLTTLAGHLTACLKHDRVEPPLACSGDIYELTLNGSGAVTHLREIWHS